MVSQIAERENLYQAAFRALRTDEQNKPAWLLLLRDSAMDRFEQLGFPSVKHEEWKYTNVAPISRAQFRPVLRGETDSLIRKSDVESHICSEAEQSRLVFYNGILNKELSSLAAVKDLVAFDLEEAAQSESYGEIVRNHLARGADYNLDGFTALNTALTSGGAFVLIPKDVVLSAPLQILSYVEPGSDAPAVFPRVLVVAETNSAGTIIESYGSSSNTGYFTNAVVEVIVGDGAKLTHYKVQRESHEAFHIAATTALLGRNSSYNATTINLGAKLSRHNLSVVMEEEGAECWVDGLYVVSDEQHTDTHSLIDHRRAYCNSHQLYKGILDGKARAVFNGKIFVRPGAQKTDAMQTNKNLLLSNDARVDTKPQLEIFADDVKCAHGAAVGQIDEEELFYLETRGIHPEMGRNLLTYGFAEEVIGKIEIASIRTQLETDVLSRLHSKLRG